MTPKSARDKGKNAERELAEIFGRLSGVKYRRVPMSGALHGFMDFDIMKAESVQSVFDGIGIECKNHKKLSVPEWIEQIDVATKDAGIPFGRWLIAFKHKGRFYYILNQQLFDDLFLAKKKAAFPLGNSGT